ncbi:MAG TPA: TA system VapC family ribonuclease toxin [Vicinamibacteria bacterium]
MILVDANVVLHAYHPQSEHHEPCRLWIEENFSAPSPIGLPWLTIWAFLRISTNPRAFEKALSTKEAAAIVSSWLDVPAVRVIAPGERYWEIFYDLLLEARVSGPLVTDAALAALAVENGASVCTTDRDFTRFAGLPIVDPSRGEAL